MDVQNRVSVIVPNPQYQAARTSSPGAIARSREVAKREEPVKLQVDQPRESNEMAVNLSVREKKSRTVSPATNIRKCKWNDCNLQFCSGAEKDNKLFYDHVNQHIKAMKKSKQSVHCRWKNCTHTVKFTCRLIAHMKSHTGERPHSCNLCNFKARRLDGLTIHKKNIHNIPAQGRRLRQKDHLPQPKPQVLINAVAISPKP